MEEEKNEEDEEEEEVEEEEEDEIHNYNAIFCGNATKLYLWRTQLFISSE